MHEPLTGTREPASRNAPGRARRAEGARRFGGIGARFLCGNSPRGRRRDRAGRPIFITRSSRSRGCRRCRRKCRGARRAYVCGFGDGAELDFVHLGALARCWAAVGLEKMPRDLAGALLARHRSVPLARWRLRLGCGAAHGNAYGCFVALGAYQDLRREMPEPLRMVQCLKFLETPDGAWAMRAGCESARRMPPRPRSRCCISSECR